MATDPKDWYGPMPAEIMGDAYEGPLFPGQQLHEDWIEENEQIAEEMEMEPDYDEGQPARDPAEWIEWIKRASPDMTFRQACALFKARCGYWPAWGWPGLPRSRLDKFARIKDVPSERINPFPRSTE